MAQDFFENSYLYGANSTFIEELYARYASNPASVDASWQRFFASLGDAPATKRSWDQAPTGVIGQPDPEQAAPAGDKKTGAKSPGDGPTASLAANEKNSTPRLLDPIVANGG